MRRPSSGKSRFASDKITFGRFALSPLSVPWTSRSDIFSSVSESGFSRFSLLLEGGKEERREHYGRSRQRSRVTSPQQPTKDACQRPQVGRA